MPRSSASPARPCAAFDRRRNGLPQVENDARNGFGTLLELGDTDAGQHLFPKHYDALAVAVIDAVAEELGMDAAVKVLARVSNDRVDALASLLANKPIEEKLGLLKSWYLDDDPYMAVEIENDDYRLIERNCPFYNTAMRRPALCSVSVNALTRLLGVRVAREEKFQNGDGRCVFRAFVNEPVDAARWQFTLE